MLDLCSSRFSMVAKGQDHILYFPILSIVCSVVSGYYFISLKRFVEGMVWDAQDIKINHMS